MDKRFHRLIMRDLEHGGLKTSGARLSVRRATLGRQSRNCAVY
jgi:hypothetical protein